MKILSLGIPKAVKFDEFCAKYEINTTDINTSFIYDGNGNRDKIKYRIYKFPEGTMITYNPSLKKLNTSTITSINDGDNEEHDEDMPKEVANDANVQFAAQFAKQFAKQSTDQIQYATRKNVGTSGFSTGKTFSQMFEENNALFEANLENIPESIINDSVLVFNIEHPENKIIAPKTRNFNTLCAVYKLKSDEMVSQEWSAIEKIAYSEENVLAIKNAFVTLGYNMVVYMSKIFCEYRYLKR
jgi:hypothetical protein